MFNTGWHLKHNTNEWLEPEKLTPIHVEALLQPCGMDIGYHSPLPMYEGQELMDDDCRILGGKCYYDGSGIEADDVLELLIKEGHQAVWEWMEKRYYKNFGSW